jgi:hypothetical protein
MGGTGVCRGTRGVGVCSARGGKHYLGPELPGLSTRTGGLAAAHKAAAAPSTNLQCRHRGGLTRGMHPAPRQRCAVQASMHAGSAVLCCAGSAVLCCAGRQGLTRGAIQQVDHLLALALRPAAGCLPRLLLAPPLVAEVSPSWGVSRGGHIRTAKTWESAPEP